MRDRCVYNLNFLLRITLGLIFVWAGLSKMPDPVRFAGIIENYRILPMYFVNFLAITLPWVEVLSGCLLLAGYLVRGSLVIINFLMVVFITALSLNIFRGIDINCGCFSLEANYRKGMYQSLLLDLPILAVGLCVLFFSLKSGSGPRFCGIVKKR